MAVDINQMQIFQNQMPLLVGDHSAWLRTDAVTPQTSGKSPGFKKG
mgnify:FL=1